MTRTGLHLAPAVLALAALAAPTVGSSQTPAAKSPLNQATQSGSSTGPAASGSAAPSAEVVVTAKPLMTDAQDAATQREAVRRFVGGITDRVHTTQMARWDREVCPVMLGIDSAQGDFVRDRIAEIAPLARLRIGRPGCLNEALVIFSPDGARVAKAFADRFPITLRRDGGWRVSDFVHARRPIRWLAVRNPCGFGGCSLGSHLTSGERSAFAGMVVVVDGPGLKGFKLGEVADYLAFVLLTDPDQKGPWPDSSVLSMFDRPRGAEGFALTGQDRAFVTAFYRTSPAEAETSQRSAIADRMLKAPQPPIPANAAGNAAPR